MKYLSLQEEKEGEGKPLAFYLAMEEYAARHLEGDDVFFVWRVFPTVIFGRNQVMEAEVNVPYCREHGISMFRRKSGGGCVYADMGNIMFSCITDSADISFTFSRFISSMALFLRSMDIPAFPTGRNDITVSGRKVSGSAFYRLPQRSIIHGTLLFDVNLGHMASAITPGYDKMTSKGISSVRQRVANLNEYTDVDIDTFISRLKGFFCDGELLVDKGQEAEIRKLMETYYEDGFLRGHEPEFSVTRKIRTESLGEIELMLDVRKGRIRKVSLKGDYFALCASPEGQLTDLLAGVSLDRESVMSAIPDELPGKLVKGLDKDTLVGLVVG